MGRRSAAVVLFVSLLAAIGISGGLASGDYTAQSGWVSCNGLSFNAWGLDTSQTFVLNFTFNSDDGTRNVQGQIAYESTQPDYVSDGTVYFCLSPFTIDRGHPGILHAWLRGTTDPISYVEDTATGPAEFTTHVS